LQARKQVSHADEFVELGAFVRRQRSFARLLRQFVDLLPV